MKYRILEWPTCYTIQYFKHRLIFKDSWEDLTECDYGSTYEGSTEDYIRFDSIEEAEKFIDREENYPKIVKEI